MFEERRKYIRLDLSVIVKWEKIPSPPDSQVNENSTKNISQGGICLIAYEELRLGERLKLEIELPTKKVIRCSGKVVWVQEFELIAEKAVKKYDAGIEFIDITSEDRKEIERFEGFSLAPRRKENS